MTDRPDHGPSLLGRDAEVSILHAFLSDMSSHGNALVMTGEPGIGATALLGAAISEAEANDVEVVVLAGADCNRNRPLAGIGRLVARLSEASVLSQAQASELGTVLADHATASSRLVAVTALLSVLRRESKDAPLLIAVDDAHDLDDASEEMLAFIAQRLRGGRTGILVATQARGGPLSARGKLPVMRIGPLSAAAGSDLLRSRFPDLSGGVRDLLVETAEGVPLALVGCAESLVGEQRVVVEAVPAVLPVSGRLRDVLTTTLTGHGSGALFLLLLLALDSSVTPLMLSQVVGLDVREVLGPILSAGLAAMKRSGAITFPRPLVRSAVVAAATSEQQRHAHALLAGAFADQVERRAHHLALSAEGPDPRVAAALQDAAVSALLRNDGRAAQVAMDHAWTTRADTEHSRYGFARAGAPAQAPSDAVRGDPQATGRLSRRLLEASLTFGSGLPAKARQTLTDALKQREQGTADDITDYAVDLLLSICYVEGTVEAWSDFRRAIRLPGIRNTDSLRLVGQLSGPGPDLSPKRLAELDLALDRLAAEDDLRTVLHVSIAAVAVGRGADCQVLLWRVLRDDTVLPRRVLAGVLLATVAISTGDSAEAAKAVDHGLGLCRAGDHLPFTMLLRSVLATSMADIGDPTLAALADEVLAWATPARAMTLIENAHWARARDALGRSDHPAAHREFAALGRGRGVKALLTYRPEMALDVVEAAAGSGHRALARACAKHAKMGLSTRLDLIALGARAVADPREQAGWFEAARTLRGAERWQFDIARIRLLHGEHLERAGARDVAREHLHSAMDTFRALRAGPWAARAAARLRPAGAAVVGIGHDLPLTRQERTVAELAVSGLTNQQIADRLHISARTVASHLYRIFNKIGVTSRAQLPTALTTG